MKRSRELSFWTAASLLGSVFLVWAFPFAFPFLPRHWEINSREASEIALERFADLGPPVENGYVVTRLAANDVVEQRLQMALGRLGREKVAGSRLAGRIWQWQVTVYRPGARAGEWTYRALISPSGQLDGLLRRVSEDDKADAIDPVRARGLADRFLRQHGVDLALYGAPQLRRLDRNARTDLTFRYTDREELLGPLYPYGVSVTFAGDRMTGYSTWTEAPDDDPARGAFQLSGLLMVARITVPWLLVAFIAYPFLRRYHEGEIGVRRGAQIFLLVLGAGLVTVLLSASATVEGSGFGGFDRRLATWAWGMQIFMLWFSVMAVTAFISWAVGEALCRERWGGKLAAVDALFHRQWTNATVARSALRGPAAGVVLMATLVGLLLLLRPLGVWSISAGLFEPWWGSAHWPGIALLAFVLVIGTTYTFFGQLVVASSMVRRLGKVGGMLAAALIVTAAFWPPVGVVPVGWEFVLSFAAACALIGLFLRYDLLTSLLACLTSGLLWGLCPFLLSADGALRFQAVLGLAVVALPFLLSVRHLRSEREFVYHYEDVPPHVRRIAERERQRVELETARRIQSSILPELPPRLSGVDIAHAYLPASEVGGDFYDVLALEDGRLAVAVGDVAGHGVSSGLVMSMAKSALAVQVTFNPDVADVFATLNRTVYQTARKRLLATLCYAVLDPKRRELLYASAGHLYPYRITESGRIDPLESTAYPLGVRGELRIEPRTAKLATGDTLFLFSDGLVEARAEGSDEVFGFARLEASLARHAGESVERLRDSVLADIEKFTDGAPREDDQTILVLRVP